MLIENGVWKGYDHEDLQNGILRIPEQVQKLDLQSIHKCMFEHFGGGKRYGVQVDPKNPIYYSEGNCIIERKTGKIVFGTAESKLPQFILSEQARSLGAISGTKRSIFRDQLRMWKNALFTVRGAFGSFAFCPASAGSVILLFLQRS